MSEAGRIAFGVAADRGVRVRILTKALEATGVAPVQVAQGAAQAGVELYEMRRAAPEFESIARGRRSLRDQPARQDVRGK